jgi:hypothetical protein
MEPVTLKNSSITLERNSLMKGLSCTFFITDEDFFNAPFGVGVLIDEAFEEFRQKLCSILNIPEEKE